MEFVGDNESFSPKSGPHGKQETEKLFQMLEVKLGQEREVWQQTKSQVRVVRTASFVFLFLLIIGAVACYFIFMRVQEHRLNQPEQTTLSDH